MRIRFALIVGLSLLAAPGCLYRGYYPNGYNGYYGAGPSVLPAQPMNGYPTGPYYQPGAPTYTPGGPIYQPGGTYPTPLNGGTPFDLTPPSSQPLGGGQPTDPNNPQTYGQPGGTNAPTFNPTTPGGTVPNPGDDNSTDFNRGTNRTPLITPTTSANSPSGNDLTSPFNQESRVPRRDDNEAVVEADGPFATPVLQTAGNGEGEVQQANDQRRVPVKPYAHHPKFAWVQGTVEYDEPSNTWVIMYDDNPRASDPYGGELTLSGDLSRVRLRPSDVVRIEGSLDLTQEDARGKPLFQVKSVQKQ